MLTVQDAKEDKDGGKQALRNTLHILQRIPETLGEELPARP